MGRGARPRAAPVAERRARRCSTSPARPAGDDPVRADGQLSREWLRGGWTADLGETARWAALALEAAVRSRSTAYAAAGPPRRDRYVAAALLTALSESTAELLCVELEPTACRSTATSPRRSSPASSGLGRDDAAEADARRAARDAEVLRQRPAGPRSTCAARRRSGRCCARLGVDVPDTRSWRLEPLREAHPLVAALLAWRKAERIATTYGYGWLDAHVGADGRLRGEWRGSRRRRRADDGVGRAAQPAGRAAARRCVAEPGHVFVRADLGQIEPRVLAAVSGDPALARATARGRPVRARRRARCGCDRPTAKVAVLAAMYGQTSGPAGEAPARTGPRLPGGDGVPARRRGGRQAGDDLRDVRRAADPHVVAAGAPVERGPVARGARPVRPQRGRAGRGGGAVQDVGGDRARRRSPPGSTRRIVLCLHDELLVETSEPEAARVVEVVESALTSTGSWWCAGSGVRLVSDTSVVRSWDEAK